MTTMSASQVGLVSIDDIESAARGLEGVAIRTPLLAFEAVSERVGAPVFVKPEMLQRGGAFKFRGAYTYLSRLSAEERAKGVIAPSSGNHAQAVALAAKLFDVPATVVMPTTVTPAKRAGAERLGARIVLAGTTTSERYEKALEIVRTEGGTLVPPYDDPRNHRGSGYARSRDRDRRTECRHRGRSGRWRRAQRGCGDRNQAARAIGPRRCGRAVWCPEAESGPRGRTPRAPREDEESCRRADGRRDRHGSPSRTTSGTSTKSSPLTTRRLRQPLRCCSIA